jgi:hypothetical protein
VLHRLRPSAGGVERRGHAGVQQLAVLARALLLEQAGELLAHERVPHDRPGPLIDRLEEPVRRLQRQ